MNIYINKHCVGEINPSSIYDLKGQSYVHLNTFYRNKLGLRDYDQFFGTMREASDWLSKVLSNAVIQGYVYDWNDGHCKTIGDLI